MEKIRICLSDLPKAKMRKGTNGKIYITLIVDGRKEPDQWGQDLKVYVDPSKEEREAGAAKVYVGSGKTMTFTSTKRSEPTEEDVKDIIPEKEDEKDDLPF